MSQYFQAMGITQWSLKQEITHVSVGDKPYWIRVDPSVEIKSPDFLASHPIVISVLSLLNIEVCQCVFSFSAPKDALLIWSMSSHAKNLLAGSDVVSSVSLTELEKNGSAKRELWRNLYEGKRYG